MKPARIFPLLLLTIVLTAPHTASAQQPHVDTLRISVDCGQGPGYDFSLTNWDLQFITLIQLVSLTDSVTFAIDGTAEVSNDNGRWYDSTNYEDGNGNSDTATYYGSGSTIGIGYGVDDTGHYFLLGGPGGSPFTRFDQPVTLEWFSEIISGGKIKVVNSGYIYLLPTSFQGICKFDTVTATGATVGCDPQFNFHVFNRNGEEASINAMKFEVEGFSAGSMRPSEIQPPAGWKIDSVTQSSVYFSSGDPNGIPWHGDLNGFIVSLLANPSVDNFTFVWTAYNNDPAAGSTSLIDRDTVRNIPATPQPCSSNPSLDSVIIRSDSGCYFTITAKNYHSGAIDTVSPITKYALKITTPGVNWDTAFLPPLAQGKWQYSGLHTPTLMFFLQPRYDSNLAYGQPGGTIWTMQASIEDTMNLGGQVTVQWTDSILSNSISSGTETIRCKNGFSDIALLEPPGAECSYALIVQNRHTAPSSPIHAISLQTSSGTFARITSCYWASNGWGSSGMGTSSLTFTSSSSNNDLDSGKYDTLHFCIDPVAPNKPATLTWNTLGIPDTLITSGQLPLAGCTPPLICDSVQHSKSAPNTCVDTITVLNEREGGAGLDTIVVTPASGTTINSANAITSKWTKTIATGNASVLFTGPAISSGSAGRFVVSYTGDTAMFGVTVTTYSAGVTCVKTDTLSCASAGVSPLNLPQSFDVTVVPNPMRNEAEISLTTSTFDRVQMVLLDILGRTERTVVDGTLAAGDHAYTLDVSQLPPGTYYLRIEASGATVTKKLVVEH